MAKMFALNKIILGDGSLVLPRTVFDAAPTDARQLDALGAARQATAEEVAEAKRLADIANGIANAPPAEPVVIDAVRPDSGAPGDPQSAPKGK